MKKIFLFLIMLICAVSLNAQDTIVKKLVSYDVISNPKTDADGNAIPDSKGNYIWIVDTVYNYKYTIRVTKLYQESNQTQTESTQNENKNNAQDVDYEEVKE